MDRDEAGKLVDRFNAVQRMRRVILMVGLVLFVVSLLNHAATIAYARSALWALCGIMCFVEINLLKRIRENGITTEITARGATVMTAILCLVVAVLPFVRPSLFTH